MEKDPERNRVIVGGKEHLFSDGLVAGDLNLLAVEELDRPRNVLAKIRFNHKGVEAEVLPLDNGRVRVMFKEPQMSVTPGQSVVFYQGEIVLGGGIIEKAV